MQRSAIRSHPDIAACDGATWSPYRRTARAAAAMAGLVALTGVLLWSSAGTLGAVIDGPATFDTTLAMVAAAFAWALVGWIAVTALCSALAAAPGRLGQAAGWCADRITPLAVQRLIRVTLGVAAAATPVIGSVPAGAASLPAGLTAQTMSAACEADTSLPGVGRPDVALPVSHHPPPARPHPPHNDGARRSTPPPHPVVVEPGDTLWSIAAERLGPGASPAEIAGEWPRWYAANRKDIGSDPGFIRPGQQLRPPA